ncbi:dihydrofolate reductase [Anoxybacterium hadale]|uniref:Dihydrofolate reductase n=1 Tax=Anoxybacterium hadale TaxID=3408580 RepID=A0ACD1ACE8_9FIRM|nr:dihydrofolate reductase [Clostridiales bacterium]
MTKNRTPRRVILDLAVTLDGFIEGKNGEVDWCIMEPDMSFPDFLNQIDTILYGRKSYDLWGQYIPKDEDPAAEKEIWNLVHSKKKYVFSRTSKESDQKATYIKDNIQEAVDQIKSEPGTDIWLYGGASLITTFINLRLVDEFRLSIHPVVLGEGTPLFTDLKQRLNLKLVDTKVFSSGVVQVIYHWNEHS